MKLHKQPWKAEVLLKVFCTVCTVEILIFITFPTVTPGKYCMLLISLSLHCQSLTHQRQYSLDQGLKSESLRSDSLLTELLSVLYSGWTPTWVTGWSDLSSGLCGRVCTDCDPQVCFTPTEPTVTDSFLATWEQWKQVVNTKLTYPHFKVATDDDDESGESEQK